MNVQGIPIEQEEKIKLPQIGKEQEQAIHWKHERPTKSKVNDHNRGISYLGQWQKLRSQKRPSISEPRKAI